MLQEGSLGEVIRIVRDRAEYNRLAKQFPVVNIVNIGGTQDEGGLVGILTRMDLGGFELVIREGSRNKKISGSLDQCPLVLHEGELVTPGNFDSLVAAIQEENEVAAALRTWEYIDSF